MNEITRRTFLKAIAASGLLAAIPGGLTFSTASFANGEEYGNSCLVSKIVGPMRNIKPELVEKVLRYVLIPDARKAIGHGTIELRGKTVGVEEDHAIAWYTNGKIINSEPDHVIRPVYNKQGGYFYFGRYRI